MVKVKNTPSRFPLIKIPQDMEACLFLICEELKSRKLFNTLRKAGIDDCYLQPNLDSLILQLLNLNDNNDETYARYSAIMDKRCKKIDFDRASVVKQGFKVLVELSGIGKK